MSPALVSTVTRAAGMLVAARSSSAGSRSCRTQCCGPGKRPASQRPIEPVPQPRSRTTSGRRRPAAGARRCGRSRSTSSGARARRRRARAASASPGCTPATPACSAGRSMSYRMSYRRPSCEHLARHREVTSHPSSLGRRALAARRALRRSSGSSSQRARAAASAAASPGGTSSPGSSPSGARPRVSGTPSTPAASTGIPRASASVTTMP